MNNNPVNTVYAWLCQLKLPVSRQYLDQQLNKHIAFPSLLSITDTLDDLGLENAAMVVDKEKFNEIPVPFLAHTDLQGGSFLLITKKNRNTGTIKRQLQNWSGIVLLADKSVFKNNPHNNAIFKKEKKQHVTVAIVLATLAVLSATALSFYFSWHMLTMLLTAVTGFWFSQAMIKKDLGLQNGKLDAVCNWIADNGCSNVLKKKKSGLMKWLPLADISLIWFASLLIAIPLAAFNKTYDQLAVNLAMATTAALPLVVYAVSYQRIVLKTWCTLCLFIAALVVAQAAASWSLLDIATGGWKEFPATALSFIVLALALTAAWSFIYPLLKKSQALEEEFKKAIKFKAAPSLFFSFLQQQKKVDTASLPADIVLGNDKAPIQLLVACNPYCSPCARAHHSLHELLKHFNIGITIRFAVRAQQKEDMRAIAAAYILAAGRSLSAEEKITSMDHWYQWMNLDKFSAAYPAQVSEAEWDALLLHQQWAVAAGVEGTPAIFLNGYKLPAEYAAADLSMIFRNKSVTETTLLNTADQPA